MKPQTTTTPHVIIMVGIPGAGKSTFAEHFANTFQAPIIDREVINAIVDHNETQSKEIVGLMLDELLKTHRTVVYVGSTHTKTSRVELAKKVTAAGYQPLLVWVQTESQEALRRATRKRKNGNPMSQEAFDAAIKQFSPPHATEKAIVISGKHTYATQLKIILKHLAGQQQVDAPEAPPRARSVRNIILR